MTFREASRETHATPEAVWHVWSDLDSWPTWNPDMKAAHLNGPLQMGATGMIDTRSGGKHNVVVTAYEPGRVFELESTALPGTRMAIRATVTPTATGSTITQAFEPRGLLAPIVGPMMSRPILKTFSEILAALEKQVS